MASSPDSAPAPLSRPRWLAPLALGLILVGVAVTVYLTIAHYTEPTTLACPETGIVNCAKVTTSSYATIAGVPLAVLGLVYFLAVLPLHLPVAWRSQLPVIRRLRLAASVIGVLTILALIYIELFRLNAICLYCSAVHVLVVLLFILTLFGTILTTET